MLTFISGFFTFLKSAVIVLGYIRGNSLFPEPLSPEEEKAYIEKIAEALQNGNLSKKDEVKLAQILAKHFC